MMQNNAAPQYFIIEPTRRCNFRCFMCPNRFYSDNEKGDMTLDDFSIIVSKIAPHAKVVQLYWMGEPLLNQNLFDFISILKEKTKAKIIVSTNGSLLTEETARKIDDAGLDTLIIDVDTGNSAKIYSQIRISGDFSLLCSNIEMTMSVFKHTKIVLQFLEFEINKAEREQFIQKWQNRNCKLEFSWIDTWAGQMKKLERSTSSLSPYIGEKRMPCSDLWHKMAINYRGEVNLCCHDYLQKYDLGNLIDENVDTVWNSQLLNKIRNEHEMNEYSGLCENCLEWAKVSEYVDLERL